MTLFLDTEQRSDLLYRFHVVYSNVNHSEVNQRMSGIRNRDTPTKISSFDGIEILTFLYLRWLLDSLHHLSNQGTTSET